MITRLIWTIWTSLSAVPRKAVKFNHSLTPKLTLNSNLAKSCCPIVCWVQLLDYLEILLRAWPYYHHDLCKISKLLRNWEIILLSNGQTRISWDLNLRWLSERYPLVQQPPGSLAITLFLPKTKQILAVILRSHTKDNNFLHKSPYIHI